MNINGGLKGNMIYSDEKGEQLPGNEEHQIGRAVWERGASDGKCCVEERNAQKVLDERRTKK